MAMNEFEAVPKYYDQVFKMIVNSHIHIDLVTVFNIITNFNLCIFPLILIKSNANPFTFVFFSEPATCM